MADLDKDCKLSYVIEEALLKLQSKGFSEVDPSEARQWSAIFGGKKCDVRATLGENNIPPNGALFLVGF